MITCNIQYHTINQLDKCPQHTYILFLLHTCILVIARPWDFTSYLDGGLQGSSSRYIHTCHHPSLRVYSVLRQRFTGLGLHIHTYASWPTLESTTPYIDGYSSGSGSIYILIYSFPLSSVHRRRLAGLRPLYTQIAPFLFSHTHYMSFIRPCSSLVPKTISPRSWLGPCVPFHGRCYGGMGFMGIVLSTWCVWWLMASNLSFHFSIGHYSNAHLPSLTPHMDLPNLGAHKQYGFGLIEAPLGLNQRAPIFFRLILGLIEDLRVQDRDCSVSSGSSSVWPGVLGFKTKAAQSFWEVFGQCFGLTEALRAQTRELPMTFGRASVRPKAPHAHQKGAFSMHF